MVDKGFVISWAVLSNLTCIINGFGDLITNLSSPRAIRFIVLVFSGCFLPKIDLPCMDQSIHSAAVLYGFNPFPTPCVGFGNTIGFPSRRAIKKNLFLFVGAP